MSGRSNSGRLGSVSAAGLLLIAGAASAGDDELTLSGPVVPQQAKPSAPIVSQPTTANAPRQVAPPSDRPVLAIPIRPPAGVARPGMAPVATAPPPLPEGPTLEAPIGPPPATELPRLAPMPSPEPGMMPSRTNRPSRPAPATSRSRPANPGVILGETVVPADTDAYPMSKPGATVTPRGSNSGGSLGSMFAPPPNTLPPQGPQRRGLFGLGRPAPAPPPIPAPSNRSSAGSASTLDDGLDRDEAPIRSLPPATSRNTSRSRPDSDGIKVEPRNDPAADAAVKRRVERQVREAVGNRVKDVEVRVVGRAVTIQVRGVRFFQKRGVRKSIESIPGLGAYKTTIDVLD